MYSLILNPWRCVGLTAGRCSTTATTGRWVAGRAAVFFEVMPRDAPCRLLRAGFCLAPRAALRDGTDRREPAEAFLALFFKRRRVFSATAFAWNTRSLTPFPD